MTLPDPGPTSPETQKAIEENQRTADMLRRYQAARDREARRRKAKEAKP